MPKDTYNANSGRGGSMTFDPSIQRWIPSGGGGASVASSAAKSSVPSTSTTQVNSQGKADSEFAKNEQNTLTGDLDVVPSSKTIRIKTGDTISISGVGKYLSGQYYVTGISRKVSNSDGYSNSITVMKNGFADNLKGGITADSIRAGVVK